MPAGRGSEVKGVEHAEKIGVSWGEKEKIVLLQSVGTSTSIDGNSTVEDRLIKEKAARIRAELEKHES